jgi:putative transposase
MPRKPETISFWQGRLPHWEVVDGRYFVTIHLSGAIPAAGKQRIREISQELQKLQELQELWRSNDEARLRVQRQIFGEMERWLDKAQCNTYLQNPRMAEMMVEAIHHRSQAGIWHMFEYVVMPNHAHLFFELRSGSLKEVLEGFKEWTGRQAGKVLDLRGKRFWQKEWFDHWSRSDEEDERIVEYIRQNPVKAALVAEYRQWPYGSWQAPAALAVVAGNANSFGKQSPAGPAGPTELAAGVKQVSKSLDELDPAGPAGPTT